MMRIVCPRSVNITASILCWRERPSSANRSSSAECRGSITMQPSGSPKTVAASSNVIPCLATFVAALLGSHSNSTGKKHYSCPAGPLAYGPPNNGRKITPRSADYYGNNLAPDRTHLLDPARRNALMQAKPAALRKFPGPPIPNSPQNPFQVSALVHKLPLLRAGLVPLLLEKMGKRYQFNLRRATRIAQCF